MLRPEDLSNAALLFAEPIEQLQLNLITDIARRLKKAGRLTATANYQLMVLEESGFVYQSALQEVARVSGINEKTLKKLFRDAGSRATQLPPGIAKSFTVSPSLMQIFELGLRKTGGVATNMTMTTALQAQQAFIQYADQIYLDITSGGFSYDAALKRAVTGLADEGIGHVLYPSGRRISLDAALRNTVLTGINQTAAQATLQQGAELGVSTVEVTAHLGARKDHAPWQGGIYSIGGRDKGYAHFENTTRYGYVDGLCGANCRHTFYLYFPGISEPSYSPERLKAMRERTVGLGGEQVPYADATDYQRYIERTIRGYKRRVAAHDAAGLDSSGDRALVLRWQERRRAFTRETGIRPQYPREWVANYSKKSA